MAIRWRPGDPPGATPTPSQGHRARCPLVPLSARPTWLAASGLSPWVLGVFVDNRLEGYAGTDPLDRCYDDERPWREVPELFEQAWCPLHRSMSLWTLVARGPILRAFDWRAGGFVGEPLTEADLFRTLIEPWIDEDPEQAVFQCAELRTIGLPRELLSGIRR
jgi:hypothetical protein